MADHIRMIKGTNPELVAKLLEHGIKSTDQFLNASATPKARQELAQMIGIEPQVVLEISNRADLSRINGIGGVFSDLLEIAGVDTVKELAARRPDNLHSKLVEVNAAKKIAHHVPKTEEVRKWIAEAKRLPKVLEY